MFSGEVATQTQLTTGNIAGILDVTCLAWQHGDCSMGND